jgi:hypothetical protein
MGADGSGRKAPPSKSVSDKQKGSILKFVAQASPSELSPCPCPFQRACLNSQSPATKSQAKRSAVANLSPSQTKHSKVTDASLAIPSQVSSPDRFGQIIVMIGDEGAQEGADPQPSDPKAPTTTATQPAAVAKPMEKKTDPKKRRESIYLCLKRPEMCWFAPHDEDEGKMICQACNTSVPRLNYRLKQHVNTPSHKAKVAKKQSQAEQGVDAS